MGLVGGSEDFGLVNVVDTEGLQDLRFDDDVVAMAEAAAALRNDEADRAIVAGHDTPLEPEASLPGEVIPAGEFYDYAAKYTDGETDHICPAIIPDHIAQAMMNMALAAHRLLGCKGASRSDFRWDDEQGEAAHNCGNDGRVH